MKQMETDYQHCRQNNKQNVNICVKFSTQAVGTYILQALLWLPHIYMTNIFIIKTSYSSITQEEIPNMVIEYENISYHLWFTVIKLNSDANRETTWTKQKQKIYWMIYCPAYFTVSHQVHNKFKVTMKYLNEIILNTKHT